MLAPTTLFIKHLPPELNVSAREEMLKLFGAIKVHIMPDEGKMKHTAFAIFSTHEEAKQALILLHQRQIFEKRLVVEFSKTEHDNLIPHQSDYPKFQNITPKEVVKSSEREVMKQEMELFSRNIHGIAPALGLDYLPSPLLKYKYPSPTPTIIQNISHALASVPKFYNQVLHLMNKMNLPPPFGPITPAPPLNPEPLPNIPLEGESYEVQNMDITSEEESEYESEEDEDKPKVAEKILPQKRVARKPKIKKKRQKLSSLLQLPTPNTSSKPKTEPSEVFESQPISQKKISMKNIEQIPAVTAADESIKPEGGFGEFETQKVADEDVDKTLEPGEEKWNYSRFISLDELRKKRLSSREMKTMSIFRNFTVGEPTFRLYIKNLAKQVEEKDLRYIFGRFIDRNSEQERNMFDIRLMKEGRMKGQAFVTLGNEKRAIEAVKETNGFVLHTKPLVVQFARSAKPKEGEKKSAK